MRLPLIRRSSGWVACFLCALIPVLVGCGDYCLFCEGQGSGGGGGGQERTAEAGDVILADQFTGSISVYESSDNVQRSLLSGQQGVSGLALYSSAAEETCDNPFDGLATYQAGGATLESIDTFSQEDDKPDRLSLAVIPEGMTFAYGTDEPDAEQTTTEFLFFTVNTDDTLYIYDLTKAKIPEGFDNPYGITNTNTILTSLFGSGFFQSPTALAITSDGTTATLFVLNDKGTNSSIRRLSVNLLFWIPTSAETIATMTEADRRLIDIAYYDQTDELFVSKKADGGGGVGAWVHSISDATERTSPLDLDSDSDAAFIAQFRSFTGIEVAPTNDEGTAAEFLVLREVDGQIEQYDIDVGGEQVFPGFNFGEFALYPQAIEYDCTNERLVMTDVPFNEAIARQLFELAPNQ